MDTTAGTGGKAGGDLPVPAEPPAAAPARPSFRFDEWRTAAMTTLRNLDHDDTVQLDRIHARFGDLSGLSVHQRVLLVTDGTVTHVLEALTGEPIALVKLAQSYEPAPTDDPELSVADGEEVIRRRVLLQGSVTGTNHLYADSVIMPRRLHPRLYHDLVHTSEPIGRLLALSRIETFRDLVAWGVEPAGPIGEHFGIGPDDLLISRTYRMLSDGQPIMVITEKFPASAFSDP